MTTTSSGSTRVGTAAPFAAVLWRDIYVTGRELPAFLAQVVLQPLLLLFVFGRVLTDLGYARAGYSDLLFPGIVAMTTVLTSLQSTALPLVIDFSFTKEIEDRLLAPMPMALVAVEKMVFAALRALVATVLMFPIGWLVLGSIPVRAAGLPLLVAVVLLGAAVGSTLGMTLGTLVPPSKINLVFALVLTPLIFTGCSQYPWPSLSALAWFQWLTALNPITYISEGMRAALVPSVPHINAAVCVALAALSLVVFGALGIRGFLRRALD